MEPIIFKKLYNKNKKKLYKHNYYYYFLHNYLFRYSILIVLLLILLLILLIYLFYYKNINIYILFYTILLFVLCIFYIYTNRSKKCFLLSSKIIPYNNNIKPIETKNYLLDKPFKEFYVNSSHNSYIPCNQNLDIASLDSIKKVLLMGAKCIELDIHDKNNTPVVAHGIFGLLNTSYLSLEDCLDVVVKYGFLTSDPFVLFIEVNTTNESVLKKTSDIIKSKLGDRLLSNEYKIKNNNNKRFIDEPIKNLLNKVIIVNSTSINKNLEDILDDNTYQIKNNNSNTFLTNNNNYKYMKRIYSFPSICSYFSCNYDPVIHWKNKANFVSLNFQTLDDALIKNHTMFKNYSYVHFSEISFD
jgi:hypothetical protein